MLFPIRYLSINKIICHFHADWSSKRNSHLVCVYQVPSILLHIANLESNSTTDINSFGVHLGSKPCVLYCCCMGEFIKQTGKAHLLCSYVDLQIINLHYRL